MRRALWTLATLLSHWRRHPMQFATLLVGLISATALWSGVQALNQQARQSYDRAAALFGGARTAMLVPHGGNALPQQLFVDLRRAGWPVSPVVEGPVQVNGRSFRLIGIEPVPAGRAAMHRRHAAIAGVHHPARRMLVSPETLPISASEGERPQAKRRAATAALQANSHLALVVDIGIAQQILDCRPVSGSGRQNQRKLSSLQSVAGDRLG